MNFPMGRFCFRPRSTNLFFVRSPPLFHFGPLPPPRRYWASVHPFNFLLGSTPPPPFSLEIFTFPYDHTPFPILILARPPWILPFFPSAQAYLPLLLEFATSLRLFFSPRLSSPPLHNLPLGLGACVLFSGSFLPLPLKIPILVPLSRRLNLRFSSPLLPFHSVLSLDNSSDVSFPPEFLQFFRRRV